MFGLGYLELGLLLLLLIILFGGRRTGWCLGKAFGFYQKVEDTKHNIRRQLTPGNLIRAGRKKASKEDE